MKKLIKWFIAILVYYSGAIHLYRFFCSRKNYTILRYHKVLTDLVKDNEDISVSRDVFEEQIKFLKKNYKVISLEKLVRFLHMYGVPRKKVVALTFDDGYKNNFIHAYPSLKKHNIPATIFLTADYIGTNKLFEWDKTLSNEGDSELIALDWKDIKSMDSSIIQFGSHGANHRILTDLDMVDIENELSKSKNQLKEAGLRIKYFCYPKGYFNSEIKDFVKEVGYRAAFQCDNEHENADKVDFFAIKRKAIHQKLIVNPFGKFSRSIFALEVDGFFDSLRSKRKHKDNRKTVLYIIDKMTRAGSQRHLFELVNTLDKRDFNPIICCIQKEGELGKKLRKEGIPVISLNLKNIKWFNFIKVVISLSYIILKNSVDIVHTYLFSSDIVGPIAARLCGVKTVISSRRDLGDWRTKKHLILYKISNLFVDKIVADSYAVKKETLKQEGLAPEKIDVIHNGLNPVIFSENGISKKEVIKEFSLPQDCRIIGNVSNISKVKGHIFLLKAFNSIKKDFPNLKLLIVGKIKDEKVFKQLLEFVDANELYQDVIFAGGRADVPKLLSAIDIFVHPSLTEGFSNALLEAMASAKAVIATSIGGNAEVIEDGLNGVLVPPADEAGLEKAMRILLQDTQLAQDMGEKVRAKVFNQFTSDLMTRKFQNTYLELSNAQSN